MLEDFVKIEKTIVYNNINSYLFWDASYDKYEHKY